MGKKVNKQELAEIFGVTERTLTTWQKIGLPIEAQGRRGQSNTYDTEAVHGWLVRRELSNLSVGNDGTIYDYEAERARLTKWQADEKELQAKALRGKLLPAELVISLCQALVGAARVRVLGIASKVRARNPGLSEAAYLDIDDLAREALEELGDDGIPQQLRGRMAAHIENMEAAEEADTEPMG